jgi:hypothetical protein
MAVNQYTVAAAQTQAQSEIGLRSLQPPVRAEHRKALYFPIEDVKTKWASVKDFTTTHLAWDPFYRLTVMTRPYYDPPQMGRVSQVPLRWDDAEMHEDKTQISIMVSGTGSLALRLMPNSTCADVAVSLQPSALSNEVGLEADS